jgi:hypothetical protein
MSATNDATMEESHYVACALPAVRHKTRCSGLGNVVYVHDKPNMFVMMAIHGGDCFIHLSLVCG